MIFSRGNQIENSSSTAPLGVFFALLLGINQAGSEDTPSLVALHVVATLLVPLGLEVGSSNALIPWLSATLSGPLLSASLMLSASYTFHPRPGPSLP